MAIRVTQRNMYGSMINNMQNSLAAYMESTMQGSTQKRINRPSDDPAGTFRVLTARNQIQNTDQYKTNVETAKGWLQLADNVVATQTSNILTQLKELAEQASTDTYTAEQRKIMADEARALFGTLLNLGNTEFDGKSIFAGHRYDSNAFEESLAVTSWDKEWADKANEGAFTIEGSSDSTIMVQFTSDGTVGNDNLTYRWSADGGDTWTEGTLAATADPTCTISANGVTLTVPRGLQTSAADKEAGPGANNGTLLYIRPTAEYKGDDNNPPPDIVVMGGQDGLGKDQVSATGNFGKDVLVRFDTAADLATTGNEFTYSYSTDGGNNWVTAKGTTTGGDTLRLTIPGGYMDFDTTGVAGGSTIPAGAQIMVHPDRADLNYEIMEDTYVSVNSVGMEIFGGYYQGKPALPTEQNVFELAGEFIAYLECDNRDGCAQVLAKLTNDCMPYVESQAAKIGAKENRVETVYDILDFRKLDQQELLSNVEDIDLTELLTNLTRQQMTYSMVLQSSSMIMQLNLSNFL
ncbi:flagellar hook protein [uncultured Desulfovibrio sp.]|uniref:flagellin N-terminal helical domain-containing protein n=1 Tax=uncultured Desulfovibrio sp. TaxID=167968 RepID=UPI00320A3598